jgi:hypothetical protein
LLGTHEPSLQKLKLGTVAFILLMQGKQGGTVDLEAAGVIGVVVVLAAGFFATITELISETANTFIILLFL